MSQVPNYINIQHVKHTVQGHSRSSQMVSEESPYETSY